MHVMSIRTYLWLATAVTATATATAITGILEHGVQRGSKEFIHGGPDGQEETLPGRRLDGCIRSVLDLFLFF